MNGTPDWIRTSDLQIRSLALYPSELRAQKTGVSDGDRTHDHRSHNPVLYQLSYAHHENLRKWSA